VSTDWVMVRLKPETREAIRRWGEAWQAGYDGGWIKQPPPASPSRRMDEGPSVEQLVAELLRRDEAHRARARRQRRGGGRSRAQADAQADAEEAGGMAGPDVATTG